MFCKQCGKEIKSGAKFCTECGAVADATAQPTAVPNPNVPNQFVFNASMPQGPGTSKSSIMIVAAAVGVLFLIVLVGAAWFLSRHSKRAEATVDPQTQAVNGTERTETKSSWSAMSKTAVAITGDVALSSNEITIKNVDYPLTLVRDIPPDEVAEVARIVSETRPSGAQLFKVERNIPEVCDPAQATWMLAVFQAGEKGIDSGLSLAFFTGGNQPNLNYEIVSNNRDLCGTFAYTD